MNVGGVVLAYHVRTDSTVQVTTAWGGGLSASARTIMEKIKIDAQSDGHCEGYATFVRSFNVIRDPRTGNLSDKDHLKQTELT